MKRQILFSLFLLILVVVLLTGCAAKQEWPVAKIDFDQLHWPEIDTGSVSYHFAPWGPAGVVMKVHYDDQKILSVEVEMVECLEPYIPMLIESIKGGEGVRARQTAHQAHRFLVSAMRTEHPRDPSWYEDTPYKSRELTETSYAEWKKWWADPKRGYGKGEIQPGGSHIDYNDKK